MKTISLREFQRNSSQYLNELPVVLSVYNKPEWIVTTLSDYEKKNVSTTKKEVFRNLKKEIEEDELEVVPNIKCSAYACSKQSETMGRVYSEDLGEYKDVPMCKFHAAKSFKEVL